MGASSFYPRESKAIGKSGTKRFRVSMMNTDPQQADVICSKPDASREIVVVQGMDKTFYELLIKIYHPFLLRSHMKDKRQFLIGSLCRGEMSLAGCISIGDSNFVQIALAPDNQGKGVARKALDMMVENVLPLKRVGWTAHRSNYPSLKLLKDLKGGIYENCLKNPGRVKMEGFYRPSGEATRKMQDALSRFLPISQEGYGTWRSEHYARRTDLIEKLENYLSQSAGPFQQPRGDLKEPLR